jgi:hypothetical protein
MAWKFFCLWGRESPKHEADIRRTQDRDKEAIQLLEFAHACVRRWERMLGIDGGGAVRSYQGFANDLKEDIVSLDKLSKKDRHWLGWAIGVVELPYNEADESMLALAARLRHELNLQKEI